MWLLEKVQLLGVLDSVPSKSLWLVFKKLIPNSGLHFFAYHHFRTFIYHDNLV